MFIGGLNKIVRSQGFSFFSQTTDVGRQKQIVPYILFKNTVLNTSLSASYTT